MSRDRLGVEAMSSPSGEFPSRARSAVTNHKDLLPGLDGRSATARSFRDLVNAFVVARLLRMRSVGRFMESIYYTPGIAFSAGSAAPSRVCGHGMASSRSNRA